jgi:hypothetical protein
MQIEFDETKRRTILKERGLDLADAGLVFAGEHYQIEDDRKDYGETLPSVGFPNWPPRFACLDTARRKTPDYNNEICP